MNKGLNCIRSKEAAIVLQHYSDIMSYENIEICEKVAFYQASLKLKLEAVFDKNIRMSSLLDTIMLKFAFMFNLV